MEPLLSKWIGSLLTHLSQKAQPLQLVSIHHDRFLYESEEYLALETHWSSKFTPDLAPEADRTLTFEHGVISITKFGSQFIDACHHEKEDS